MGAIAEAFNKGGVWMYVILGVSVLALAVIIERFIFLYFKYNINAHAFMAQIHKLIMADNIDRAIKLCNAAPTSALSRVVKAGLTRADKGEVEIQNAVEEAQLEVVPKIMKRTAALPQLANVSTLLGLLGTIIGLIQAFTAMDSKQIPIQDQEHVLSQGIALAMYTTAFGLMVAIPCLLAYLLLSGMSRKIVDEIDQHALRLENLLVSRVKRASTTAED